MERIIGMNVVGAFVLSLVSLGVRPLLAQSPVPPAKAWIWYPNSIGGGTFSAPYNFSSTGVANTVTRLGTGYYEVDFPNTSSAGILHVSAYGGAHSCWVAQSYDSPTHFAVRCFLPDGTAADGGFSALYYSKGTGYPDVRSGHADAYVVFRGFPALDSEQWNSTGGANSVAKLSAGTYRVTFQGIANTYGIALVTAYGGGEHLTPTTVLPRCSTAGWGFTGSGIGVDVRCTDYLGNPTDSPFAVSYMADVNLTDMTSPSGDGGYVWGYAQLPPHYNPIPWTQFNTERPGANTIEHLATGSYRVAFPGLISSNSSNAQVGAVGSPAYCNVGSWNSDGAGGTILMVKCFSPGGAPADSYFTALYVTNHPASH
jgi:hypothetical protein